MDAYFNSVSISVLWAHSFTIDFWGCGSMLNSPTVSKAVDTCSLGHYGFL